MAEVVAAVAGVIGAAVAIGGVAIELAPTHRQCSIEIKNRSKNYSLCNPRMYLESGGCSLPLSPAIESSSSSLAQFSKTANTGRGSVGVFTYDLVQNPTGQGNEKIAVMFSVPYDFVEYSNLYAVGVFDITKECDHDLFNEMYNDSNKSFVRAKASDPCLTYKGNHITIMAAMSDSYQPVIKLQVTE